MNIDISIFSSEMSDGGWCYKSLLFFFDRDRMILLKMEQEIIDFISDNK